MSDMPPQPSAGTPLPAVSPSDIPDQSAPWLRWIVLAAVALAAMLVGAGAAATSFLVLVQDGQQDRYVVTVFLGADVTAEQKEAVESALSARYPVDGVRLDSAEETWERYREQYKDTLDLDDETPEGVSESFRVETTGEVFDCAALSPVGRMAGVRMISVVQPPAEGRPYTLLVDCL
ncbi:permease-like cell division protein FtsX [Micromonospora deserti]|uniref:permease-like cell division protein FtsX n=1 Tax=Micromonospora deserti TaxID=2070366 RepID=UPI001314F1DF|nr:permease-like cell division protein FtsX [Micromonospora deserti]